MTHRRQFLQRSLWLSSLGLMSGTLSACASTQKPNSPSIAKTAPPDLAPRSITNEATSASTLTAPKGLEPPPDIFDAQVLDMEFWLKPRTIEVVRPASKEHLKVLYWKDGEVIDSAYEQLCHILRDVSANELKEIDPKLLETLWGTQAFVARYGLSQPIQILSGYRTPKTNQKLIESGVPAARQSLHMEGRAADIRLQTLDPEVLGNLVRSFRQGGVGYYYRQDSRGGWIHADTGLKRTWKG